LFQILRNTFLTFYRRESRELAILDKDVVDGPEELWDAEAPVAARVGIGTVVDLERAIRELPEEFRSVLLFADLEGFTLIEIAQIMETPVGTVKSRLFRARRLLRRRLADYRTD
jgi:RNA polymerase sigma-70 factor (ECF subfamily)